MENQSWETTIVSRIDFYSITFEQYREHEFLVGGLNKCVQQIDYCVKSISFLYEVNPNGALALVPRPALL